MFNSFYGSCSNHYVEFFIQDRLNQFRDIRSTILIVRIRVHNDVSTKGETGIKSSHKCPGQPLIPCVADNMIHTVFFGYSHSIIYTTIINNQPFYYVKTRDLTGQVCQGNGQCFGLIIAGYLNNKFYSQYLFFCPSNDQRMELHQYQDES